MASKEELMLAGAASFEQGEARPTGRPHWTLAARQAGWDQAQSTKAGGKPLQAVLSAPSPGSVRSGAIQRALVPGPLAQYGVACHKAMTNCRPIDWDQAQRHHVTALIADMTSEPKVLRAGKLHRKILALLSKYHNKALTCVSTSSNLAAA